jgi:hypothetical protein
MVCFLGRVRVSDDRLKAKGINSVSDNELFNESDDEDDEDDEYCFNLRTGKVDFDRLRLSNKALLCFSIISLVDSLNTILD